MTTARKATFTLIALDALSVVLCFNLTGWCYGVIELHSPIITSLELPVLIHFLGVYLIDGYSSRTDVMSVTYTSLHVIAQVGVLLATLLTTYVFIPVGFPLQTSRFVTSVSYLAVIPISLGYRRLLYQITHRKQTGRYFVFIGSSESCQTFIEECGKNRMAQQVLHSNPVKDSAQTTANTAFNHVASQLEQYQGQIDAVILRESSHELPSTLAQRLVDLSFTGVPTYTLELFHQVYWRKIPLYRLNQTWLFQEGFQIAREPVFERMKRLSDIALSLIGLVIFAPLLLPAMLGIWLTDRGPIFFRQSRVGKNRVLFQACKLRTMRVKHDGHVYTRENDDRITPIGRFLRATRLDEVPQLWNVLCGEMSMIGPRAEWVRLVEDYEKAIPCYHFRHLVKPGITGWAQVNYPYGANMEDTMRKLEYDLYYIRFFSFVLDASIVLKTIHVMLFGKGR